MTQIYMSFCDTKLPHGQQFLGALVLYATNVGDGATKAAELGLNPGGEVLGILIPENKYVHDNFCYRILQKEEARNLPFLEKIVQGE